MIIVIRKTASRAGEPTQWLRELAVLAEDFALFLASIGRLTVASNCSRRSETLFWPLGHQTGIQSIYIHSGKYLYTLKTF